MADLSGRRKWWIARTTGETFVSRFTGMELPKQEWVTVETEEGDGLDLILNEVFRGVKDGDLEVTMVDGDAED